MFVWKDKNKLKRDWSWPIYRDRERLGQWLWRSWLSSRFQYQRSAVRIQPSAILSTIHCIEELYWKDENKEKRGREWPNFRKDWERLKTGSRPNVNAKTSKDIVYLIIKLGLFYCLRARAYSGQLFQLSKWGPRDQSLLGNRWFGLWKIEVKLDWTVPRSVRAN